MTFLKVDKGVAPEKDGVQLMKPVPDLAALLDRATANRIFGTKMRSVIKQASRSHGVVACFSRALVEGLSVGQSEDEYNRVLEASIQSIFEASNT